MGRTTRLDAINIALKSSQLAPVESLESGDLDAEMAESTLDEVLVEVLTKSWYWNRQTITFMPDANSEIILSDDYLNVEPTDRDLLVSQRGLKLYDLRNGTFKFESPVELVVTLILEFEELPQSVRRYVTYKTARLFQERTLGDSGLDQFILREEQIAWQQLTKDEIKVLNYNHIAASADTLYGSTRVRPRLGGSRRFGRR